MYMGPVVALGMVALVVGLFYIFHKKVPATMGTINVYLTVIFSFMIMQLLIHTIFLLVPTQSVNHFLLLKESALFSQDMVKLTVGGLLGALLPIQKKLNNGTE